MELEVVDFVIRMLKCELVLIMCSCASILSIR